LAEAIVGHAWRAHSSEHYICIMKAACLCIALVLERACTLLLQSEQGTRREAENVGSGAGPTVAMCLSGNARSFPEPRVLTGLQRFLSSGREQAQLDVFAHLTLQGADPKGQEGWNFRKLDASQRDVELALKSLRTTAHAVELSSDTVNSSNLQKYVAHEECFSVGYFGESRDHLIRSCNQFVHIQRCLQLIKAHEEQRNTTYGTVMVARPDLIYSADCDWSSDLKIDFNLVEAGTTVYYSAKWDWLLVMPRRAAADLAVVLPLQCAPGQECCRRIGDSENLFEYTLGFPTIHDDCPLGTKYENEVALNRSCFGIARPLEDNDKKHGGPAIALLGKRKAPCYN